MPRKKAVPIRPDVNRVTPPKHLSAEAQDWWSQLMGRYGFDSPAQLLTLQTALEAFDRMRQSQQIIARDGATVTDRFDQVKSHPQLTVERDSRSGMMQSLKALDIDLSLIRAKEETNPFLNL